MCAALCPAEPRGTRQAPRLERTCTERRGRLPSSHVTGSGRLCHTSVTRAIFPALCGGSVDTTGAASCSLLPEPRLWRQPGDPSEFVVLLVEKVWDPPALRPLQCSHPLAVESVAREQHLQELFFIHVLSKLSITMFSYLVLQYQLKSWRL